jgi:hypothetical protein
MPKLNINESQEDALTIAMETDNETKQSVVVFFY